jgi:hypothetical protein
LACLHRLRVASFLGAVCAHYFAQQNNLPPYFYQTPYRLLGKKKKNIFLGFGPKIFVRHLFGLLRCSVHVHMPIGMHMHIAQSTAALQR